MAKKDMGDKIVGGVEGFGRFWAEFSAIFATIIGIGMIIGGIFALIHKTTHTKLTQGTIQTAACTTNANEVDCDLTITYSVNGKSYPLSANTTGMINWKTAEKIHGYYNPNDPIDAGLSINNTKILGWVLIGIALFLIIGSWFTVWLVNKYKWAAFGEGALGGIQLLKNI
mgnify:FL=1